MANVLDKKQTIDKLSEILNDDLEANSELMEDLTKHQRMVLILKMRGASQESIGELLHCTQPAVSNTLKRVKEKLALKAKVIDQLEMVGENMFFYEDVERQIMDIKDSIEEPVDQLKALSLVVSTRHQKNKLLMDLGILTRAPKEVTHRVTTTPLLEKYKDNMQEVVELAISPLQDDLEAPEPPDFEEEDID